jgi:hypothetical protein
MDDTSGISGRVVSGLVLTESETVFWGVVALCSVRSKIGFRSFFDAEEREVGEHDTTIPNDTVSAERSMPTRYFLALLAKLSIKTVIFADKVGKNPKIALKVARGAHITQTKIGNFSQIDDIWRYDYSG